ncbi:glycosyltransferase family 4 protein [Novosphingobium album (ex Liu et al. 2023)]|uniref:Glycosyltransferase n=1 Tax=Novosphingobium album (ex Liu et al. 2023) TaxID=3031130 RepID=A0ABT5WU60_9SPHN|nr:glycosyltransferase [Novosphingobium album (ex Liu et al. 2023)]MDE8653435.1 glycosyltransferase [Novosphingobium album (ex Liu et al. 2023)]
MSHVAVIGNALPRQCGLATYTSHSVKALREHVQGLIVDHYAMDDGHGVEYGDYVKLTIDEGDITAYVRAAATIERSGAQVVWLHHEYGIFGGQDGDHILAFLNNLSLPVVATLHTVLAEPNPNQYRIMRTLIGRADRLIVMAQRAADLLVNVYRADPACICVIPHGAPDRALSDAARMRARIGLGEGRIALTFGLLSPGKGIETVIRALPRVVDRHPDLRYLVVGATHPALIRSQGERYRQSLQALARDLGVERHVQFVDRFLDDEELLDYLQAADIYLTAYLSREQVTSGTLSYALAMGRPVISTPYFHAEEALADGVGSLVPFGDVEAIADALHAHLSDPDWLAAHSRRVWEAARPTIWAQNARAVMDEMVKALSIQPVPIVRGQPLAAADFVDISGMAALTDDVGIIQHTVLGIPDRSHGYCLDDNVRALMLTSAIRTASSAVRARLTRIYAAFVQHAWNPEERRFRNFMGFDRSWLESTGSEDSNGRTLWTLGEVVASSSEPAMRRWANGLFNETLSLVEQLQSPRARAFAALGMAAVLEHEPTHPRCGTMLRDIVDALKALLDRTRRPDWPWFEIVLAYDNARLPQAMIEAGRVLGDAEAVELGLESLDWLLEVQRAPAGYFRPVGSESFGRPFASPEPFDQQPLEASATIEACASAYRVDPRDKWIGAARRAMAWFEGENDLGQPLITENGTMCFDGLTPAGVNLNHGAESVLALQFARHAMTRLMGENYRGFAAAS